ncbi:LON peptidase N-terminal domain and RING finger protein 2 [Liparis tanakae]|uniref:LON peptidase N-terminal domain and RING finger protein 2 n=1 Tax=Liparis tanakae TaxID=230148 RepID=A0A4Z2FUG0_9TELE|nr:LON peptidase N-terminal domain and RING finger protein 2 [Liparis tanakae]
MEMKSFSQAVQDGSRLCRMRPLWTKAHRVKATALSEAGRTDEALDEYLMCVALKPDWTAVKMEAQKDSAFILTRSPLDQCSSSFSSSSSRAPEASPGLWAGESSTKSLADVLASLPAPPETVIISFIHQKN